MKIQHANAGRGMCLLHPARPGVPVGPYGVGDEWLCDECVRRYLADRPRPGMWPTWHSALQPVTAIVVLMILTGVAVALGWWALKGLGV